MARRYRMTPRRRAALTKAREASARKRRRQRNKRIAVGAVTVVSLTGAGYSAGKYYRQGAALAGMQQSRPSSFYSTSKEVDLRRTWKGAPIKNVNMKKKPRKVVPKKRHPQHVFKASSKGTVVSTNQGRLLYDRRRRSGLVTGYERKPRPKKYKTRRR